MLAPKESVKNIPTYKAGKSIEEFVREKGIVPVKLASNENPFGPPPGVIEKLKEDLYMVHRYPDRTSALLREKLAQVLRVDPECIVVTNGSNEVIELVLKLYVTESRRKVLVPYPSFTMYEIFSKIYGAEVERVSLVDFKINLQAFVDRINADVSIIFLANPNNPTGSIYRTEEFKELMNSLREDTLVVVDEAYYDFVEDRQYPDTLDYVREGYPVVVMRTFSKAYGLAGLRIGYAVTTKEIAHYMNKVRQPFNVNLIAQKAALYSLDEKDYYITVKNHVINARKFFYKLFDELSLFYIPSEANFVSVRVGDAKRVYSSLLDRGIIVRDLTSFGMPEFIRVTIGKTEENIAFADALKGILRT